MPAAAHTACTVINQGPIGQKIGKHGNACHWYRGAFPGVLTGVLTVIVL